MRLEVRYVTSFRYPERVRESYNLLRARPAVRPYQNLVSYELAIEPAARVFSYHDYWGTAVDAFGIRRVHDRLVVRADSVVDTFDREEPTDGVPAGNFDEPAFRDEHYEYLQPSRHTGGAGGFTGTAEGARSSDAVATIRNVADMVHEMIDYAPGSTYVGMDVNEVLDLGKGVCQDFVHLALAMYRSLGIPARYVSGYFYAADQGAGTVPDPAEITVQTHAWVEAAVPGWGWWALDPTNATVVGPRHIEIGHGRDYDDVLPLRGVYHGPGEGELAVSVRMSREQMSPFAPAIDQ